MLTKGWSYCLSFLTFCVLLHSVLWRLYCRCSHQRSRPDQPQVPETRLIAPSRHPDMLLLLHPANDDVFSAVHAPFCSPRSNQPLPYYTPALQNFLILPTDNQSFLFSLSLSLLEKKG